MEIRAGIGADLKNHTKYPEQPVSARAEAVAPEQPLKMDASRIKTELLAGLTVALALVPEAVAFAFVAGVAPLVGLYAAFYARFSERLQYSSWPYYSRSPERFLSFFLERVLIVP